MELLIPSNKRNVTGHADQLYALTPQSQFPCPFPSCNAVSKLHIASVHALHHTHAPNSHANPAKSRHAHPYPFRLRLIKLS